MKNKQLRSLEKVTDAKFQKRLQDLRPILEAEARVRQQLTKLDAQMGQMREESALITGYQISGTDVLWNSWESATRRHLNMQLAQIRAQKLMGLGALRSAFGRKQAVETLVEKMQQDSCRAAARKLAE